MTTLARLARGAALALALVSPALPQTYHDTGGTIPLAVVPLIGCSASGNCAGPVSSSNPLPVSGALSASLAGFSPSGSNASLSAADSTSHNAALPTGTDFKIENQDSNPVYCALSTSGSSTATTGSGYILAGSSRGLHGAYNLTTYTNIACISPTSSLNVKIEGGSGLATDSGGGSGSGGSVPTGSVGSPNAAVISVQGISGGTAVPVSGTFWQSTQPVSLASLPALAGGSNTIGSINNVSGTISLPTGAATSANQSSELTSLSTIAANTAGASTASNQTAVQASAGSSASKAIAVQGISGGVAVPVSGAFWQATQPVSLTSLPALPNGSNTIGSISNISGTVSLPTGAATSANQSTEITSLGTIAGAVSSSKMAVKAASGDFADGAVTTIGTEADSAYSGSGNATVVSVLKGIYSTANGPVPAGSNTIGAVQLAPGTSNGWTGAEEAGITSPVVVKPSAGVVALVQCDNIAGGSAAYVQLINAASAPAVGTGIVHVVALAAGSTGGFSLTGGEQYSSGISIGAATTASGSTAVSTPVNCTVDYK